MRKILFAAVVACALLASCAVHAQVVGFGQGSVITGTTNTPAVDTNQPSVMVKKITVVLSSANTVTGLTGNVWLTYTPTQPTNGTLAGTFTATNFTSTNFTFTGYYTNPILYTVLQAQCGTNVITATEIYGPNQY